MQFSIHFQHLHEIPLPPMKEFESSIIEVVELCTHYAISSLKTMVTKFTLIFLSCDYFRQTHQLARLPDFHSILDSNAQSHRSGTFQAENEGKNLLLYNADTLSCTCNYPFSGKHPRPGLEDAICALISQYEKIIHKKITPQC